MNLKKLIGFLSASVFITSCGTTNLVQENPAAKKQGTVLTSENSVNSGASIKLRIAKAAFNTKSASGHTFDEVDYVMVNLSKSATDPLASGNLLTSTWVKVNKADFGVETNEVGCGDLECGQDYFTVIIKNITNGSWYAVVKAYHLASDEFDPVVTDDLDIDASAIDEHETAHPILQINKDLTGDSFHQRIDVSEGAIHVKGTKFYANGEFNSNEIIDNPTMNINLIVEAEASVTGGITVNDGLLVGEPQALENLEEE